MADKKVRNFLASCKNCRDTRILPRLGDSSYGEFLGRSKNAEVVYLNSFEPEVDQFFKAFKHDSGYAAMDENSRRHIVQHAVGRLLLDPDTKGDRFTITGRPECSQCGHTELEYSDIPFDSPECWRSIPAASFLCWLQLSEAEKAEAIADAITSYKAA